MLENLMLISFILLICAIVVAALGNSMQGDLSTSHIVLKKRKSRATCFSVAVLMAMICSPFSGHVQAQEVPVGNVGELDIANTPDEVFVAPVEIDGELLFILRGSVRYQPL